MPILPLPPTPDEIKAACKERKVSVRQICMGARVAPGLFYRAAASGHMSVGSLVKIIQTINAIPIPPPTEQDSDV